jgi:hypothetical protein
MEMGANSYVGSFPIASGLVAVIRDKRSIGFCAILESLENFFDA